MRRWLCGRQPAEGDCRKSFSWWKNIPAYKNQETFYYIKFNILNIMHHSCMHASFHASIIPSIFNNLLVQWRVWSQWSGAYPGSTRPKAGKNPEWGANPLQANCVCSTSEGSSPLLAQWQSFFCHLVVKLKHLHENTSSHACYRLQGVLKNSGKWHCTICLSYA